MDLKSFEVGHFVIFVYEGAYFVGKIDSICEEGAINQFNASVAQKLEVARERGLDFIQTR